ncbi:MAG: hypothetical protein WCC81_15170 [Pseudolabrys sp.]
MLGKSITRLSTHQWPASQAIRAELVGSHTCRVAGVTVRGPTPILTMCARLVRFGINPATPLDAYRGDTLCLSVRSIGEAAALALNGKCTGFVKRPTLVCIAPPVAPKAQAGIRWLGRAIAGAAP